MAKNEHYPTIIDEMSSNEKHSEIDIGRSGEKALLQSTVGLVEADKAFIVERAIAAMDELIMMAQAGEPLWIPIIHSGTECLNKDEYSSSFPNRIELKPVKTKSEASRESVVIFMNPTKLVEILMDVEQWSTVFSGIVSRASIIDVLSTGMAGNYNGALQVITAEFHVLSPLVPTQDCNFIRYSKQHDNGTWAVADVSLNNLGPAYISQCQRRPSGCLIQELSTGFSKVTWVEHVEIDDRYVDNLYKSLVNSGLAFGAKHWITTLHRQCARLLSPMEKKIHTEYVKVMLTPEGRKSVLKLSKRMMLSYCNSFGVSAAHTCNTLCGDGATKAKIMAKKNTDDPGMPYGTIVSVASSFWIQFSPEKVFDFLNDETSRNKWDMIASTGQVYEIMHISNGCDPSSCISLLNLHNSRESNTHILKETRVDSTASYVIYTSVDTTPLNVVLSGGDPTYVALLPSGFVIHPDGPRHNVGGIIEVGSGGSLLTVAFQIMVHSALPEDLTCERVAIVNTLTQSVVERIQNALVSSLSI
ncbi:hypothetical protein ACET3Z_003968 [Daucus carota]